MHLNAQQTKLFIRVDGVIGDRRRICTFCNNTIHGAEKIVETTRKLRRGPYFPQLAHLQSSVGKIDTMGRAVVCLPCFHQLLRQWNLYEQKNIPMSRRVYKHVSDKGVKNYQETRASEIRAEAEKRAFAIQTNQEHIVKKAFERLTKRLDAQEETIQQSEECIEKLNHKLSLCTTGEQWKINREIKKQQKIIAAAEARIEDEEDKEELIRKETKSLLEVYRRNQSLFRPVSEPDLFQSHFEHKEEKAIVFEDYTDRVSEHQVENSESNYLNTADTGASMNRDHQFKEYEYQFSENGGYTVVKDMRISQSEDETDSYHPNAHAQNDDNLRDVWTTLEPSKGFVQIEREPLRDVPDWHMPTEIVYSARSDEVQSFPEDEWSKLFDKEHNDNENQPASKVSWVRQSNQSPDDTEWERYEGNFVKREDQQWEEIVNTDDSDDETEQVYEVNAQPFADQRVQRAGISDSYHVLQDISSPNRSWEDEDTSVTEIIHEYNDSSDVDPWDKIQIEKEREKPSHGKVYYSVTSDGYRPVNVVNREDKGEYIDEYDQDNFSRGDKVILSPKRLDPDRFSEFTKSASYIPEPAKEVLSRQRSRDRTTNSTQKYNGIEKFERQKDPKIVESSNCIPEERRNTQANNISYDPLEPLRKNRNFHDRHLSAEEEEWETKHLSPKRLDETKWFNFINDNVETTDVNSKFSTWSGVYIQKERTLPAKSLGFKNQAGEEQRVDSVEKVRINSTFMGTNNSNNTQERRRNRLDDPSDGRLSPNSEVERSPTLRKLMKQDEISEEQVQRVTTRASVQSSPWDDLESQSTKRDSEVRKEPTNETIADKKVGRIDLKQWSFEVERNRSGETKASEPLNNRQEDRSTRSPASVKETFLRENQGDVVIINRNQSPKKAGDVYILESKNDNSPQDRIVGPSLKYKGKINFADESASSPNKLTTTSPTRTHHYQETVIIEDDQGNMNQDDDYLNRKQVGRLNLSLWEQNALQQNNTNGPNSSANVNSTYENRSQPISFSEKQSSVRINGDNSSQFDNGQGFQHARTSSKKRSTDDKLANSPREEDSTYANHRSFNKSMSEDELAWEKRFSKSYERKISVEMPEEQVTQRKVSDHRIPRLGNGNADENDSYISFGKISLDEDEVRRVRDIGNKSNYRTEGTYITSRSSIDRNNVNPQSSVSTKSSRSIKYGDDISQLTEEELAWEEKTSRPGRLDFSKFSQFK